MRLKLFAVLPLCGLLSAQVTVPAAGGHPQWRSELMGLPEKPRVNTAMQDLSRFEHNVQLATPYFAALRPGDYASNQELLRRMWTFLAAVHVLARQPGVDRELGRSLGRAHGLLAGLGLPYVWANGASPAPAPETSATAPAEESTKQGAPPFALQAPDLRGAPQADRDLADELGARYDSSAARAASAWYTLDSVRGNLEQRAMTLHPNTTASMNRVQLYLDAAAAALRKYRWKEAQVSLERAEYVTDQLMRNLGR